MNDYYYGIKLEQIKDHNGKVESVIINNINFIDYIKDQSEILNKDNNYFYQVNFYLYINKLGVKYVIISMFNEKQGFTVKEVYDIGGTLILVAYDSVINDKEFNRKIGGTTLIIKDNKINKLKIKHVLPYISDNFYSLESVTNNNIGIFDIETYKHTRDENSYVYALGYKIYKEEEKNLDNYKGGGGVIMRVKKRCPTVLFSEQQII